MLVKEERLKRSEERMDERRSRTSSAISIRFGEPVESYAVTGDFWDEKGHDDEGYWHESDLRVHILHPGRAGELLCLP